MQTACRRPRLATGRARVDRARAKATSSTASAGGARPVPDTPTARRPGGSRLRIAAALDGRRRDAIDGARPRGDPQARARRSASVAPPRTSARAEPVDTSTEAALAACCAGGGAGDAGAGGLREAGALLAASSPRPTTGRVSGVRTGLHARGVQASCAEEPEAFVAVRNLGRRAERPTVETPRPRVARIRHGAMPPRRGAVTRPRLRARGISQDPGESERAMAGHTHVDTHTHTAHTHTPHGTHTGGHTHTHTPHATRCRRGRHGPRTMGRTGSRRPRPSAMTSARISTPGRHLVGSSSARAAGDNAGRRVSEVGGGVSAPHRAVRWLSRPHLAAVAAAALARHAAMSAVLRVANIGARRRRRWRWVGSPTGCPAALRADEAAAPAW